MPYTRLKAKCLACNLHFVVYSERPEQHSRESLHCPECGQHRSQFLTWRDEDSGEIREEVPGLASLTPDMNVDFLNVPVRVDSPFGVRQPNARSVIIAVPETRRVPCQKTV